MQHHTSRLCAAVALALAVQAPARAFTFETGDIKGSFDSNISVGTGIRTQDPACSIVLAGASGSNAPQGCLAATSALGDQGDLDYRKDQAFTTYLKGTHELLLKGPDETTFMGRVNWVRDFSATHTSGVLSGATPTGAPLGDNNLASDANDDLRFNARILDLWVSKGFSIGDEHGRIRAGNQVISWGESLFLPGGINSTNAMDIMRLSQPGTQLKEVMLPAPMISVASGLGGGFNGEAYVQTDWNANYFAPTGSYWSTTNGLGRGHDAYGLTDVKARNSGQWGLSLRYQPQGTQVNFGLYAMNYHDKAPEFSYNIHGTGQAGWTYPEDRKLYGVSANLPVGDWALGTELSYRPHDAVSLNSNTGCASQDGNCWVDQRKFQWHLTGLLSLTPGSTGAGLLSLLHADTATLLSEAVVQYYPGLQTVFGSDVVAAGGYGWGQETNPAGTPVPVGTSTASAINFDFSWVYDGTVLSGWQLQPEVYYFQALSGRTPNPSALIMQGAKSANFVVTFTQNPANWIFAVNYSIFRGGSSPLDQPLRDRDFVGLVLTRNL